MYVVILRWMLCLDVIQLFGRALRFQNNFWNNISARDAFPFVVLCLWRSIMLNLTFRILSYVERQVSLIHESTSHTSVTGL